MTEQEKLEQEKLEQEKLEQEKVEQEKVEREKEIKQDNNDILLMIKGSLVGALIILTIYLISLFV